MYCKNCGKKLLPVEISLTKKLINRGASEFFCLSCLAEHFSVGESDLLEKASRFKKEGCTLFSDLNIP